MPRDPKITAINDLPALISEPFETATSRRGANAADEIDEQESKLRSMVRSGEIKMTEQYSDRHLVYMYHPNDGRRATILADQVARYLKKGLLPSPPVGLEEEELQECEVCGGPIGISARAKKLPDDRKEKAFRASRIQHMIRKHASLAPAYYDVGELQAYLLLVNGRKG